MTEATKKRVLIPDLLGAVMLLSSFNLKPLRNIGQLNNNHHHHHPFCRKMACQSKEKRTVCSWLETSLFKSKKVKPGPLYQPPFSWLIFCLARSATGSPWCPVTPCTSRWIFWLDTLNLNFKTRYFSHQSLSMSLKGWVPQGHPPPFRERERFSETQSTKLTLLQHW